MEKLVAPISYQGGKQRIASDIIDIIKPSTDAYFYDLCCGSGAVSIELVNRGFDVNKLVMLDKSIWGLFWKMIGEGSFDLDRFENYIKQVPNDLSLVKSYLESLALTTVTEDSVYVFLLLQAGSFGGKAIWIEGDKWKTHGFRDYWKPTETSNRRYPVNPMMPLPSTLLDRVKNICKTMKGIKGINANITEFVSFESNSVIYIDPPYSNTTLYGYTFDIVQYVRDLKNKCYVSESKKLSETTHMISEGRKKGGISGERKVLNEEWLSVFN